MEPTMSQVKCTREPMHRFTLFKRTFRRVPTVGSTVKFTVKVLIGHGSQG